MKAMKFSSVPATCGKVELQAPTYIVGRGNENNAKDGLGKTDGDKEHSDCPIEPC